MEQKIYITVEDLTDEEKDFIVANTYIEDLKELKAILCDSLPCEWNLLKDAFIEMSKVYKKRVYKVCGFGLGRFDSWILFINNGETGYSKTRAASEDEALTELLYNTNKQRRVNIDVNNNIDEEVVYY